MKSYAGHKVLAFLISLSLALPARSLVSCVNVSDPVSPFPVERFAQETIPAPSAWSLHSFQIQLAAVLRHRLRFRKPWTVLEFPLPAALTPHGLLMNPHTIQLPKPQWPVYLSSYRPEYSGTGSGDRFANSRTYLSLAHEFFLEEDYDGARRYLNYVLDGNESLELPRIRMPSDGQHDPGVLWMMETESIRADALTLAADVDWMLSRWTPHLFGLRINNWRPLDWANATVAWFQSNEDVSPQRREAVLRSLLSVLRRTTYTFGHDLQVWVSILALSDSVNPPLPDDGAARIRSEFERLYAQGILRDRLWEDYLDVILQNADYPRLWNFISYSPLNVAARWSSYLKRSDPETQQLADRLMSMLVGLYDGGHQDSIRDIFMNRFQGDRFAIVEDLERLIQLNQRNHSVNHEWLSRASLLINYFQNELHLPPLIWKGPPHVQHVFHRNPEELILPYPVREFSIQTSEKTYVYWFSEDGRWLVQERHRQNLRYASNQHELFITQPHMPVLEVRLDREDVRLKYLGSEEPVTLLIAPPYRRIPPLLHIVQDNLDFLQDHSVPVEGWYLFDGTGRLLEKAFDDRPIPAWYSDSDPRTHLVHARIDRSGLEIIDVVWNITRGRDRSVHQGMDEYWADPSAVETLRHLWQKQYRRPPAFVQDSEIGRLIYQLLSDSSDHKNVAMAKELFLNRVPIHETLRYLIIPLLLRYSDSRPLHIQPGVYASQIVSYLVKNWWEAHSSEVREGLSMNDLLSLAQPLIPFLTKMYEDPFWIATFANLPQTVWDELIQLHRDFNADRWEPYLLQVQRAA